MRTTLTLDPDVAQLLDEEVHRLRKPFKVVVNEALRRALSPRSARGVSRPYRVHPHVAKLTPGIDPAHLNALADEMEIEAAVPLRRPRRAKAL
jgi:hypothetical protein